MNRSIKICGALVLSVLSLVSCGDSASTRNYNTSNPTKKVLGVYELDVNGTSGKTTASVRPVGVYSRITQQVNEVPFDQLSFNRISMVNLVDIEAKAIHMSVSFKVINNTGKTIIKPTFIPVGKDSFFKDVTSRTGKPISPEGMTIEKSHQILGGMIQEDFIGTPLVNNLDLSNLQILMPDGSVPTNISSSGWQPIGSYAVPENISSLPGYVSSGLLSFGIRVPMQGDDIGDNDPFKFRMTFAVVDLGVPEQ